EPQVLSGNSAKPGIAQGGLVLTTSADAKPWTGLVKVKGTAIINGKTVEREARPASISWGNPQPQNNNGPLIARLDRNLVLAVRETPSPYKLVPSVTRVTVKAGEKIPITLKLTRAADVK